MRHPLNVLLRIGRGESERQTLLGDLEEAYRADIRPKRSVIGAQAWYAREVLVAFACALRDSLNAPLVPRGGVGDVRYAFRRWRRRPGFAVATIATLALGIAAATTTFSVVDGVLLRPLPWKDVDRLVYVHGVYPDRRSNPNLAASWDRGLLSYPAWDAMRTSPAFETVAVWRVTSRAGMTFGEGRDDVVRTADVSSNFLPMLGVGLAMGRYFTVAEDEENTDSIILTWETWQRRFGARPGVIGKIVVLGHASSGGRSPKRIVGVLQPGFNFDGETPEILLPVGISAAASRQYSTGSFRMVALLARGVSIEEAEAQASGLAAGTRTSEPISARLVHLADEQLGAARRPLWLLFSGAGLLLLIACSNVVGILLGEANARRHEIAVRTALGGARTRLVRQLLVEYSMLAIAGTALGVCGAYWLIGVVVAIAPEGLPRIGDVRLDIRAATFAACSGAATLLLFGVGPAMSLVRTPVAPTLADGGREGLVSRAIGQRAVVIAQLAVALVLLTAAGLFGETMRRLTSQPLGFNPEHLAVITASFTGERWGDPARRGPQRPGEDLRQAMARFARETSNARDDQVFERVAALPGVRAVAKTTAVPFVANAARTAIVPDGHAAAQRQDVLQQNVSERYFEAMGVRRLSGRLFGADDRPGDIASAVVSRAFEHRFFPEGAVNRRFDIVFGANHELASPHVIVGVVDDVKRREFSDDDLPLFYSFDRQSSGATLFYFVVRASADVASVLPAVREAIRDVTPQLVVTSSHVMSERVARSVTEERFRAMLAAAFGVTALALAAVGLYGAIARRSTERRREFGVRIALGARPADVGGLVLRDAALLLGCGFLLGLPAAYATAQLTRSLLFGISPSSPLVFAATAGTLAGVAAAASFLPARRASLADPVNALRS